jgi:hypothetical protein
MTDIRKSGFLKEKKTLKFKTNIDIIQWNKLTGRIIELKKKNDLKKLFLKKGSSYVFIMIYLSK